MTRHRTQVWSAATLALIFGGLFMPTGPASGAAGEPRRPAVDPEDPTLWMDDSATRLKHIPTTVSALAYAPGGGVLFAGDFGGRLHRVALPAGRDRATFPVATGEGVSISALAVAPDGRTVAVAVSRGSILLVDAETGRERTDLRRDPAPPRPFDTVTALAFSPDGRELASASGADGICLREAATGRVRANLGGHVVGRTGLTEQVLGLAYAPDGATLASACADRTVQLWDVASGGCRATLGGAHAFSRVAFSPDGRSLAACEEPIRVWDLPDGRERAALAPRDNPREGSVGVGFLPGGKVLLSAYPTVRGEGRAVLWDLEAGRELATLPIPTLAQVMALAPDGRSAAVGGYTGSPLFGCIDLIAIEGEDRVIRRREPIPRREPTP